MPDRMSAKESADAVDSRRVRLVLKGALQTAPLSAIEPVSAPPKRKLENRQGHRRTRCRL
jgi:hypothetical protein